MKSNILPVASPSSSSRFQKRGAHNRNSKAFFGIYLKYCLSRNGTSGYAYNHRFRFRARRQSETWLRTPTTERMALIRVLTLANELKEDSCLPSCSTICIVNFNPNSICLSSVNNLCRPRNHVIGHPCLDVWSSWLVILRTRSHDSQGRHLHARQVGGRCTINVIL